MANAAFRKFENYCQELNDFVIAIDGLDERSDAEHSLFLEQRVFLLTYFDKLIRERIDNANTLSKFDQNLARVTRLFYTDMQLIFQSVKEFYMRRQETSVGQCSPADSQRVYALLVHCVNKQKRLLEKIRTAIQNQNDRVGEVRQA